MQRLALHFTVLLALICFSCARSINLSRTELEAIQKVLNVALQPSANEQHKLLERFQGRRDHGEYRYEASDNKNVLYLYFIYH